MVYLYHIFIHSSADRHLGCFFALAIVDSAAKNFRVHISFELRFSPDMCQGGIAQGTLLNVL